METLLEHSKAHPAVIAAANRLVEPVRRFVRLNKTISAESIYTMAEGDLALRLVTPTQRPAVIVLAFRAAGLVRTDIRVQNYEPSARYRKTYVWAAPAGVAI